MSYTFPDSLNDLRKYLKSRGFEGDSIKTSRQAAFVAQQLLGTRVKFPPKGSDMMVTLLDIQSHLLIRGVDAASTPGRSLKGNRSQAVADKGVEGGRKVKGNRPRKGSPARKATTCDFSTGLHIFCDGASVPNPGAGGWGVVVYRDGVEVASQRGGNPDTTNNQMELTALLVAIEKGAQIVSTPNRPSEREAVLESGQLSRRKDILPTSASSDSELVDTTNKLNEIQSVTIWSDSQYCVNGVNDWLAGWKRNGWNRKKPNSPNRAAGGIKNLELWQAIDDALSRVDPASGESVQRARHISVRWVKGHAGIAGNERADELAEIGRQEAMELVGDWPQVGDDLDERYRQIMGAA